MAKITIDNILASFASTASINNRFNQIEDELNSKVLYRNNPVGEANSMSNDLDMNNQDILNLPTPSLSLSPIRLIDLLASSSAIGSTTALLTSITDSGGYFTSDNVEGALQELGSPNAIIKNDKAEAVLLTPVAGQLLYILSEDGRGDRWRAVTGLALGTINDNSVNFCGTEFRPTGGDGTIGWRRDYVGDVWGHWFGTKGDATTNDSPSIQEAVDSETTSHIRFKAGEYLMSDTVSVPVGIYLIGVSSTLGNATTDPTKFIPDAASTDFYEKDGSQTANGYLFFMNIDTSAPTTWIVGFPNIGAGGAKHIFVDGTNTGNIKGFYFAGSYEFEDIRNWKVSTLIKAVEGEYQDHINVKRIFSSYRANATDWLIELDCLGDNVIAEDISCGYTGLQTGIANGILFSSTRGGHMKNIINGVVKIKNAANIRLNSLQLYGGNLIIDDSEVIADGLKLKVNENGDYPIEILSFHGAFNQNYQVRLDNITFDRTIDAVFTSWPSTEIADIKISSNRPNVIIGKNCQRVVSVAEKTSKRQSMGIVIENQDGTTTDWDNYSHILSRHGTQINSNHTDISGHTPNLNFSFGGISTLTNSVFTGATYQGTTGTKYYGIQLIIDPVRLLGVTATTTPEASIATVNGSTNFPTILLGIGAMPVVSGYMIRVYRGTSSGSYDKYIDIPILACREFWDDGNALNGFPWKTRTASGMDTLNDNNWSGQAEWIDNHIKVRGTASADATVGTWVVGDEIIKTNRTIDGNNMMLKGFHRLTSGSNHITGTDWAAEYISNVTPAT